MGHLTRFGLGFGVPYLLTFIDKFNSLNGVYTVTRCVSWNEILIDEINIFSRLYQPLGREIAEYRTDSVTYEFSTSSVLKCYPNNETNIESKALYIPEGLLGKYPDPDVAAYHKLMLSINLGVFADSGLFINLLAEIQGLLRSQYGIAPTIADQTIGLPQLVTFDGQWMSSGAYADLAEARKTVIDENTEAPYALAKRYLADIANAQAKITALEQVIATLNNQIKELT